jgi:hypothetical protein
MRSIKYRCIPGWGRNVIFRRGGGGGLTFLSPQKVFRKMEQCGRKWKDEVEIGIDFPIFVFSYGVVWPGLRTKADTFLSSFLFGFPFYWPRIIVCSCSIRFKFVLIFVFFYFAGLPCSDLVLVTGTVFCSAGTCMLHGAKWSDVDVT